MHKTLYSVIDKSVNFIVPYKNSVIEARYVRRAPHYVSAYVSSHNGCKMGCKFCWLTNSEQTNFDHVSNNLYASQLDKVLEYSKGIDKEGSINVRVNINMMSRGEPLANKFIINDYADYYQSMHNIVDKYEYKEQKVNISTIMPYTVRNVELSDIFKDKPAYLYYSLYSTNSKFRSEWIKNGIDWKVALQKLKSYQSYSELPVAIHFSVIDGENDNLDDVRQMCDEITSFDFKKLKFNIVKFNPHPSIAEKYKESSKINEIFMLLKSVSKDIEISSNKSRIVDRAGPDVYASCGMFIE